jgi:RNA polymerase sigma factor (sigma-70 family)
MFSIEKDIKTQLPHIKQCCGKFAYDEEVRDLLYSDVLEKIWKFKNKFSGTEAEFKGWAYMVTKNAYISTYHKEKRRQADDIDEVMYQVDFSDSYDVAEDIDTKQKLNDVLYTIKQKLNSRNQEIFKLCVIDGLSGEEVADQMEVNENTVRGVVHKIRKYISDPLNIITQPREALVKSQRSPIHRKLIVPKSRFAIKLMDIINQYNKALELKY